MRVLLASSFHYRRGGDSGQFLDLASQLESAGHEVAVFSMDHPQNLASPWRPYWLRYVEYRGDLSVLDRLSAALSSVHNAEGSRRMARLLRDFNPDVVHFHSVHHHLTLAAVEACILARIPTVWTLHDYRCVCPATSLLRAGQVCERCAGGRFWHGAVGRCKSGALSRSMATVVESYLTRMRRTLARVDCYVAPSRFLGRKVVEMGMPAKRMEIVPNPVQPARPETPSDRRDGLMYVGRLSPEKGVSCLIRAVAGLDGVSLRIVGDGPQAGDLRALSACTNANAIFEGWTDEASVRAKMREARLLCVPSVWYENCPGVVLEAMASSLAVVASDLGGLSEMLDNGRAGWLARPGDADDWRRVIVRALGNADRSASQAMHALSRVEVRHDPQRFLERIEAIYRSVLH